MISTSLPAQTIAPSADPRIFTHIVTLIHRMTGDEKVLRVETLSIRFANVIREITQIKAEKGLLGYEIYEVLDCNDAF